MKSAKRWRALFKIVGAILFACLLYLPASAQAEQKEAEEVVNRMNAALLENMKRGNELGFQGRYKLLSPVLHDVFALRYMGEKTMGNYWKELLPEQQKQFMEFYSDWTISSYAGNFEHYSGEIFETHEGKQINANTVSVISKIVKDHEEAIKFDYTVRRFQDKWRIIDIRISGVSQLSMTRAQFQSVMKTKGFDGLMALLKGKIADYHIEE